MIMFLTFSEKNNYPCNFINDCLKPQSVHDVHSRSCGTNQDVPKLSAGHVSPRIWEITKNFN